MAEGPRQFTSRLRFQLASAARDSAAKAAKSKTIANSLEVVKLPSGEFVVESPFYWAVYYHDGRGAIRARPGHKLVYFRNPDDDPRIGGAARNYPKKRSDIRRLTKAQFYRFLRDPNSGMIVRDSVGPSKGDPFFTRGLRNFPARAGRAVVVEVSKFITETLGDEILKAHVKVRFRI